MKKFFSFSETISGKTFFLRTLFTVVLSFPILAALILFEIVSDYIVLSNSGIITNVVSLIGLIIFAFLTLNNSKFEKHEG